jgi:hypothetical protein
MSYLDSPRIHFFSGYFADPSTINNNLTNYDLKPPLDLSASRRLPIQTWIKNGCPEGEGDA